MAETISRNRKEFKRSYFCGCTVCASDFSIAHGGKNDITTQVKGKQHKRMADASSSSQAVTSFFKSQNAQSVIEAETRWAMFVAKHNLAFLCSDRATKLFPKMFPDSEIVKKFACGRTKTTAIVKSALSHHYLEKTVERMSNPFSVLMDESNDKTDKSCIILVKVLDPECGDVRT